MFDVRPDREESWRLPPCEEVKFKFVDEFCGIINGNLPPLVNIWKRFVSAGMLIAEKWISNVEFVESFSNMFYCFHYYWWNRNFSILVEASSNYPNRESYWKVLARPERNTKFDFPDCDRTSTMKKNSMKSTILFVGVNGVTVVGFWLTNCWWAFFVSLSLGVSANLTTNGEEHPWEKTTTSKSISFLLKQKKTINELPSFEIDASI